MDKLKEKQLRLNEVSDLLAKVFQEAGEGNDITLVKSLKGTTDAEKQKEIEALLKEKAELKADIASLEALAAARKENDADIIARKSALVAGVVEVTEKVQKDEVFQKRFVIPATAKTRRSKCFKDDRNAYGLGMHIISLYGEKVSSRDTQRAKDWSKEHIDYKSLSGQAAETGGNLVPYEFLPDIIDLKEQYGVFMRNINAIPMTRETAKIPRAKTHNTAYWDTDNGQVTESAPAFDNVNLIAKKLSCWLSIPMELVEDAAIDIGDWVARDMGWKFGHEEDRAGFIGDGGGTYGNIVGLSTALLNLSATRANIAGVQVASGNLMSEVVVGDLVGWLGRLPAYAIPNARIYCSNRVFWQVLVRLALAQGGVTFSEQIGNGRIQYNYLGIPVEVTQAMPMSDANDQILALYGDINLSSKAGDRRAFNIATSDQVRFLQDQLVVRANERIDINNHDVGNADSTAANQVPGPMVGLLSAAS